jgi:hypothetical protein
LYQVNIRGGDNLNMNLTSNSKLKVDTKMQNIQGGNNNSPLNSGGARMMRVIKGGGGVDNYNSNPQNHFFSKMLMSNGNTYNLAAVVNEQKFKITTKTSDGKKINLDKFNQEKYEQEQRMLDSDDLNNSGGEEQINNQIKNDIPKDNLQGNSYNTNQNVKKTPSKDKNGIWNIFQKIISK